MIYQLMKRDPEWTHLPYFILVSAVAGLFFVAHPQAIVPIWCWVGFMAVFQGRPHQRASRFEATLPVAGRQLFLARMSFLTAFLCLPAIAAGGAILLSGGSVKQALAPPEIAFIWLLFITAIQSVRVRELCAPRWVSRVAFPIMAGAVAGVAYPNAETPALMVCAPLSVALFFWTLRAVPKSFQLAPPGARSEHRSPGGVVAPERPQLAPAGMATDGANIAGQPDTVWMPLLRSVFSRLYAFWLPFLFFGAAAGLRIGSCCLCLPFPWLMARQQLGWARTLPIRPRIALWTFLAPALLTLAVGYFASFLGARPPLVSSPWELVLNLAATIEWALLVVLFMALFDWRRLRHASLVIRRVLLNLLLGIPILATLAGVFLLQKPIEMTLIPGTLLRPSRALPGNPAAAIAFAAVELAALYWALERVFEEAEYTDKPRAPQDDPFLQA
jgi:hypothetical protein